MPSRHRGTYVLQFCLIDVNYNDPKKETKRTSYLIQKKKKRLVAHTCCLFDKTSSIWIR